MWRWRLNAARSPAAVVNPQSDAMVCKKALTECEGDIAKAVDWLREKGIAKSAKKEGRIAAEGLTRVAVSGNTAVLFEVNSETDFVSKNEQFLGLMNTLQEAILANNSNTTERNFFSDCSCSFEHPNC